MHFVVFPCHMIDLMGSPGKELSAHAPPLPSRRGHTSWAWHSTTTHSPSFLPPYTTSPELYDWEEEGISESWCGGRAFCGEAGPEREEGEDCIDWCGLIGDFRGDLGD